MDNFFITKYFDWKIKRVTYVDRMINLGLRSLGVSYRVYSSDAIDGLVKRILGRPVYPFRSGLMTNIEQRINMFHLVSQVLSYDVEGDFVELGCNEGQSSVLIQELITNFNKTKTLHLYDSFEGLPALSNCDGSSYREGGLETTEDVVRRNFNKYKLKLPEIHKGWFKDTLPYDLPEAICFAYLDGDLYDSTLIGLKYVYPKMTKGAICLIDDYCDPEINPEGWNYLPGVKKACDEFLADKPEIIDYIYSGYYSHGFFRKM
ncbi:MAG: TylF/MycF/NovP-related O-methyltransferase [Methylocella sp.]